MVKERFVEKVGISPPFLLGVPKTKQFVMDEDLNNLDTGVYSTASTPITDSLLHKPSDYGYNVIVVVFACYTMKLQLWADQLKGSFMYRLAYNNGWGSWYSLK